MFVSLMLKIVHAMHAYSEIGYILPRMAKFRRVGHSLIVVGFAILVLLMSTVHSSQDHPKSVQGNKITNINSQKFTPQLTFQIKLHAFLLWASIGFLMPVGILIIRMSHRVQCGIKHKLLFYSHVVLQLLAVLLATAGAALSIMDFQNSFNNTHQRIGVALYAFILLQPLTGVFRPHRGVRVRSIWYFLHWLIGSGICILGIINIYIGLHAYHEKSLRSVRLWTILFTTEISIIAFIYLLQDRWDYTQKQGMILGDYQIRPTDNVPPPNSNQKEQEVML